MDQVVFTQEHKKLSRLNDVKLSKLDAKAEKLLHRAAKYGSQKQLNSAMALHQKVEYARLYKARKKERGNTLWRKRRIIVYSF